MGGIREQPLEKPRISLNNTRVSLEFSLGPIFVNHSASAHIVHRKEHICQSKSVRSYFYLLKLTHVGLILQGHSLSSRRAACLVTWYLYYFVYWLHWYWSPAPCDIPAAEVLTVSWNAS
ncbi:hypothetical protein P691DRAFT_136850 [Macrolepiota fuliginosa MF-IS2]|uniref:Uncharacterized protein n=1 Tax=Macrolepiota fuliginosa MF-IS2 TaxID=1400762 RepID=A0A9P5XAQ9_9AGAR|nr:hypothetical protein P691DRAFT_136850 [Macrolepiota fuliginosa MF-IS2]